MVPDRLAALTAPTARPPAGASTATVAVVRSDDRRAAVAEALALLDDAIRPLLGPPEVVTAWLGKGRRDSAAADGLSALVDALIAGGSGEVVVASGAPDAAGRFRRYGYDRECWGRPVRFVGLAEEETAWVVAGRAGTEAPRMAGTVVGAGCRIALVPIGALTGRSARPSSRLALLDATHADDRPMLARPAEEGPLGRSRRRSLLAHAWPDLSVIEGPLGRWGRRGLAIAGTDPVAVDLVAGRVLGRGGRWVGPLAEAARLGFGVADPERIAVVGDPVDGLTRLRPGLPAALRADRAETTTSGPHGEAA